MKNSDDANLENTSKLFNSEQGLRSRLDVEWIASVALREVVGIAQKQIPTFGDTLGIASILAPEIFSAESLLLAANEGVLAKQYRQKAAALSKQRNKEVTALSAIDEDISEYRELLQQATSDESTLLNRHYVNLKNARARLSIEKYTETQSILRDISSLGRNLPITGEGKGYKDFQVTSDRGLRIRMLHPDPWEHVLGVDVIYETHWEAKKRVRLVAIQYKMWSGKKLYVSQAENLLVQIGKMRNHFCQRGYCNEFSESARKDTYRLPYCSVFLRLTDRIQTADYQRQTSSYHTPICAVEKSWSLTRDKNQVLEGKMIKGQSLSQKSFEEMFNIGMLGSRWLTHDELKQLYEETDMLRVSENINIHAQQFSIKES
jgi:hypothetical protein